MTTLLEFALETLNQDLDRSATGVGDIVLTNREDSVVFPSGKRFDSLNLKRATTVGVSRLDRNTEYAGVGGRNRFATDGISIRIEGLHVSQRGGVPNTSEFVRLCDAVVDVFDRPGVRDDPPGDFHALEAPDRTRRNAGKRDYYRTDIEIRTRGYL